MFAKRPARRVRQVHNPYSASKPAQERHSGKETARVMICAAALVFVFVIAVPKGASSGEQARRALRSLQAANEKMADFERDDDIIEDARVRHHAAAAAGEGGRGWGRRPRPRGVN